MKIPLRIEKLNDQHFVGSFDCGVSALNNFLSQYALVNQKMELSTTYVALKGADVVGFYSLAFSTVRPENAPKKVARGLPQYDVPVMLLARLAVDKTAHGLGLGRGLLKDAMLKTIELSDVVGVRAMLVHAKDKTAAAFYERFDFAPSPFDEYHLFLRTKDMKKSLLENALV